MSVSTARRAAVVVAIAGALVSGCSSKSSDKPSTKVLTGRLTNTGRYALVHAKVELADGPLACTVKLDDGAKVATYTCNAKTTGGKAVVLSGHSTYKELKNGKKKSVTGTVTATVDGTKAFEANCIGSGC